MSERIPRSPVSEWVGVVAAIIHRVRRKKLYGRLTITFLAGRVNNLEFAESVKDPRAYLTALEEASHSEPELAQQQPAE